MSIYGTYAPAFTLMIRTNYLGLCGQPMLRLTLFIDKSRFCNLHPPCERKLLGARTGSFSECPLSCVETLYGTLGIHTRYPFAATFLICQEIAIDYCAMKGYSIFMVLCLLQSLRVFSRILDSCTELMKMIKVLITSSKDLQKEIVMQGRVSRCLIISVNSFAPDVYISFLPLFDELYHFCQVCGARVYSFNIPELWQVLWVIRWNKRVAAISWCYQSCVDLVPHSEIDSRGVAQCLICGLIYPTLRRRGNVSSCCSYFQTYYAGRALIFQGASSSKEFYMKNSRWTEGLISAAKAVGSGATMLT